MDVKVPLFSGFKRVSTVPAGNILKASLVGANTVNGPGPSSVSTSPAAFTAATSVVWSLEFTAFWIMFLDGYISAPPTFTGFCAKLMLVIMNADRLRNKNFNCFILVSYCFNVQCRNDYSYVIAGSFGFIF